MKKESILKFIVIAVLLLATFWFGIKPLITGDSLKNYIKSSNDGFDYAENEFATIVFGSEPEGIAAALACARTGLKTLLVTEDSNLGSYITKSMIALIEPEMGYIDGKKVKLNNGIYEEIFGIYSLGFSGEDYRKQITKLAEKEENLHILYNSEIDNVKIENGLIKEVWIKSKNEKKMYKARNFIDATQKGDLLENCGTPYIKGSEDIGSPGFYSPLEFNFLVTGVDTDSLKKGRKTTDFFNQFELALLSYEKTNPNTRIISPSFVILNHSDVIITGMQVFGVNAENAKEVEKAFAEAEEEAIFLTAYLKNVLTSFKDCTYKKSPENFFIPEIRHYEGRYKLTVSDILENRNFRDNIALCSAAVDAGRFVKDNMNYIVTKPKIYGIPLGSIIPSDLDNVMMVGSKAGFSSLASTSAGSIPCRITTGESAGLISAYSFLNNRTLAELLNQTDEELEVLKSYLRRGGIKLDSFSEDHLITGTNQKLKEHWAYPHIKELTEYGLIVGGNNNDFKLDYKASWEVLSVLIKNVFIKMAPDFYTLELDIKLKAYENKAELTGEKAAEIVLTALDIPAEENNSALKILKDKGILSASLTDKLDSDKPVTMDVVYGIAVETVKSLKR